MAVVVIAELHAQQIVLEVVVQDAEHLVAPDFVTVVLDAVLAVLADVQQIAPQLVIQDVEAE